MTARDVVAVESAAAEMTKLALELASLGQQADASSLAEPAEHFEDEEGG